MFRADRAGGAITHLMTVLYDEFAIDHRADRAGGADVSQGAHSHRAGLHGDEDVNTFDKRTEVFRGLRAYWSSGG